MNNKEIAKPSMKYKINDITYKINDITYKIPKHLNFIDTMYMLKEYKLDRLYLLLKTKYLKKI